MKWFLIGIVALSLVVAGCGGKKAELNEDMIEQAFIQIDEGKIPDYKSMPLIMLKSGLEYIDLKEVDPDMLEAEAGHVVTVHYHGWLSNGRRFDSSIMNQVPFTFELGAGKVIRGWDEGVQGMRQGTKRLLVIPSTLAYGSTGVPGRIPPDAPLIFYVNMVEIQ